MRIDRVFFYRIDSVLAVPPEVARSASVPVKIIGKTHEGQAVSSFLHSSWYFHALHMLQLIPNRRRDHAGLHY
jgi:hypothetical protein